MALSDLTFDFQMQTGTDAYSETEVLDTIDAGLAGRVILFNDEHHTFEEVIVQILKAIRCSVDRAEALTWEVHSRGKAMVYEGEMGECLQVSAILEEIDLHTQIVF
jgi:ATP-dependent Clp protease adapter protein ClpS